jgi:hypothetical protein
LAFAVYMSILLRFVTLLNRGAADIIKQILKNIYSFLYNIFERKNQGFPILLLECNVNSESSNNIFYFSGDNPENNEGNNSSNSNDNSENMEDSRNSEDNPNPDNNEDSDSNSNRDSTMDQDDPVDSNVEEINDPEHNAPERIMDDLDQVDKAKNNDPDALEYLRREYNAHFDGVSVEEALKNIEEYLENEFDAEHERSEREADELDAEHERSEREANELDAEHARSEREANELDAEDVTPKRPRSDSPEEEAEKNNKRQKSDNKGNDGEDGNDGDGSAGGSGSGSGSGSGGSSNNPSTSNRVIGLSPTEEIEKEDEYGLDPSDVVDDFVKELCKITQQSGQSTLPDLNLDLNMDTDGSLMGIILKAVLEMFS